jgi:hypothetical protein
LEPFVLEEATVPGGGELAEIPGLEPFSVESLGLEEIPGGAIAPAMMGGELKPFSLEELGLDEPSGEMEPGGLDRFGEGLGEEGEVGLPTFSWQEAGTSKAPAFRGQFAPKEEAPVGGPSLFERMMASRPASAEPGEEIPKVLPPGEVPAAEEPLEAEPVAPFSLEQMGLEKLPAPAAAQPDEEGLPGLKPFSVEAFGLEEGLPAAEAMEEALAPFSLADLGLEETPMAAGRAEFAPFSLEELGLEETPAPAPAEEAALAPLALEDLDEEQPFVKAAPLEVVAPVAGPAEDVLRPFSLEELGLTPAEISALDMGAEAVAPPAEEDVLPPAIEEVAAPAVEEAAPAIEEVVPAAVEKVLAVPAEKVAPAAVPGLSLEEVRAQVATHPGDETMLLSLAQACTEQGAPDEAFDVYKRLIKSGQAGLEDAIIGDLRSWI